MAVVLAIFGVAFAAFCVWLTVRIVDRRERWAKHTAVCLAVLIVIYLGSCGPALYLCSVAVISNDEFERGYGPMLFMAVKHPRIGDGIVAYAALWGARDAAEELIVEHWMMMTGWNEKMRKADRR
jgi:hypothetical protein